MDYSLGITFDQESLLRPGNTQLEFGILTTSLASDALAICIMTAKLH